MSIKKIFPFVLFLVSISCKTTQSDYIQDSKGQLVPNLAKCARDNFPEFAKDQVDEAIVDTRVLVNKQGEVLSVEVLKVTFPPQLDKKKADMLAPTFKSSAVLALKGQLCPPWVGNQAQPYIILFQLKYSISAGTDSSGYGIEPSGDLQPWR